jgi:hypothetical protein
MMIAAASAIATLAFVQTVAAKIDPAAAIEQPKIRKEPGQTGLFFCDFSGKSRSG